MNWVSESREERHKRLGKWHIWFAWHPIRIGKKKYWLEYVYRRGEEYIGISAVMWTWEYAKDEFDILAKGINK